MQRDAGHPRDTNTPSGDTGDTSGDTDASLGGPCDPDSASWSDGNYAQAVVLVELYDERCSAESGHQPEAFRSFDDLHSYGLVGSVGDNLLITMTEPPGLAGGDGLTLEGLTMGQTITVHLTDERYDFEASLSIDDTELSDVVVTWRAVP